MKIPKLVLYVTFIVSSFNSIAQDYDTNLIKIVKGYAMSKDAYEKPDSIFRILDKGIEEATRVKDFNTLGDIYLEKAVFLSYLSENDMAIKYLFKARNMFLKTNNKKELAVTYVYLGILGNVDIEEKRAWLGKAYILYTESEPDTLLLARIWNAYSYIYIEPDSIIIYSQKSYDLSKKRGDTYAQALNLGNIALYYLNTGKYDTALYISRKALKSTPKDAWMSTLTIKYNIIDAFNLMNMPDSALHYFDLYKDDFSVRPFIQAKSYELISKVYSDINDYKKALEYSQLSDSLNRVSVDLNNKNLIKLLEMEQESELKRKEMEKLQAQSKKDRILLVSLISIMIILIILGIVFFLFQKEKRLKAKAELKNIEIQKKILSDELKFTNKELSSFAANIVKTHDHISELKQYINTALREKSIKTIKDQLRDLSFRVSQLTNMEEDRREFLKRTHEINDSLIFYLRSIYPELSDSDLNLMVLLMLNFSSKEIATLYNMEVGSVTNKRYRLRKKLGLENWERFDDFIQEAIKDFKAVHLNAS